jgi:thiol:disulfide interchange protein DsbD
MQVLGLGVLAAVGMAVVPSVLPTGPTSSLDASAFLESGQLWVAGGTIFLGGLLTALTPCVYPLIPVTVGVFGARKADSRGRAFVLTSAYVVGMGLVFSALGVFAALSGKAFGSSLGNRWVVVGLALFLVILATSMFGAFELALPTGLATKLNNVGGGGVIGALLMGSVAGFLAAPCTGPVLTGVLAWVSRTQDPAVGGALLFTYALGIGVPFFLIGVFTVRLPKGGVWMEWVKSVFGIALLALAAAYLRDAFDAFGGAMDALGSALGQNGAIALAASLAFAGVTLGAVHLSFKEGRQGVLKGIGVAALLLAFLVRMASPAPALPVEGAGSGEPFSWTLIFDAHRANSAEPFERALAQAKHDCKPVLIDFFADWCPACKELDRHTYVAKEVAAEAHRFVTIKVDGTEDHDVLDALYQRFGIQGLPTVAFVDPMGKVLEEPRVTGFLPPEQFVKEMRKVAVATCSASP